MLIGKTGICGSAHGRCYPFIRNAFLLFIVLNFIILSQVAANSWGAYVKTDGDYWSIDRKSDTMSFDYYSSVDADCHEINVTTGNRTADVSTSVRTNVRTLDTTSKESISASEGVYQSDDAILIKQYAEKDVNMTFSKASGSSVYGIFWEEQWPSRMVRAKSMGYLGKGISDRLAVYNELDYQGAAFNHNTRLNLTHVMESNQKRTNITVLADDARIRSIDLMPTGSLAYKLESSFSGMADLKFRHRGFDQFNSPNGLERREEISEGDERFMGDFNITRSTFTNTSHILKQTPETFLPCCAGGFEDMNALDKKAFRSAAGVFDCTCFEVPGAAQFTGV